MAGPMLTRAPRITHGEPALKGSMQAMQTREEGIEWFRERAGDCRQRAKTAPNERSRAMLEDMAAKWERLVIPIESGKLN